MPPSPRTAFNRSPLIRTLASLDSPPGAEIAAASKPLADQTLAERLGHWLHWSDAISLFGVLDGDPAVNPPADALARAPAATSVLAAELRHLRQQLTLSITDDAALAAELAEAAEVAEVAEMAETAEMAELAESVDHTRRSGSAAQTDWALCRRRHLAQQQAMGAGTAPLRARLRTSLQACSPALARLAALDALFEAALAERERHLLAKVPRLLEQHFIRIAQTQIQIRTQAQAQAQTPQPARHAAQPDAPAAPSPPRLQPDALRLTLQRLLLDELDLRLQPLEGLLLALQQDKPATT